LLDINSVRGLLESSPKGSYVGIIPVDFAGRSVDMEAYRKLADEYKCWIIEDACHAPGGYFIDSRGVKQFCGNGYFADLAIFSFHPVKHITCGEGGLITTNNKKLYNKLLILRNHGITREIDTYLNKGEWISGKLIYSNDDYPGWYMEMQELGFNYRITDFQAALGCSQLRRADQGLEKRKAIAVKYDTAFKKQKSILRHSGIVNGHAYHLYIIEVSDRLELYNFLRRHKIFVQIHYIPVHLMPYYQKLGWKKGDFENAEQYYERCISLPMYPTLTDLEQHFVIEKIREYYQ
jgi:dTDP-4-amino-4,6-dideoxygalactose transaminase